MAVKNRRTSDRRAFAYIDFVQILPTTGQIRENETIAINVGTEVLDRVPVDLIPLLRIHYGILDDAVVPFGLFARRGFITSDDDIWASPPRLADVRRVPVAEADDPEGWGQEAYDFETVHVWARKTQIRAPPANLTAILVEADPVPAWVRLIDPEGNIYRCTGVCCEANYGLYVPETPLPPGIRRVPFKVKAPMGVWVRKTGCLVKNTLIRRGGLVMKKHEFTA